ncbi:uncharacterized protein A1O5_08189 [Cladophialophora psammophila CBS 110553]|uniref:Cyclohexanone monooxygenase n=1 Tax=Cladophialophora psammophila CBS 110553 TaxID=1182543 RepID=W9WJU6_9EURO|nr:uncharacterized protein A1O5_08189 [Cladophialophora psammophila CBS 110553]EXJ68397.1 hypothetical protein A1O5_08189 [Cladophialophora psammophila CBS 110553]
MAPLLDIEPDSPFASGFLDLKQATVAISDVQIPNGFPDQVENRQNGHIEHVTPLTNQTESFYIVREVSMGTRKPIRVVCLGAGYSGIMMGIVYAQRMTEMNVDFCIYEKNADMGGTWLENRYPGCQCDIPAHNYSYSFEPNPNWPNYYATSRQIHDYMKYVMEKYDVEKYIHTSHQILKAAWNSEQGRWDLRVRRPNGEEFDDHCEVFINAGGLLNNWKWPTIPGIGEFEGKLMHSAGWDESYDLTGKRVAVIGIGSSGIQIVPKVVKDVDKLTVFLRSKTWISPGPGINEPVDDDPKMDSRYNYTADEISRFNSDPEYLKQHRRNLADRRAKIFDRAIKTSDLQSRAQVVFRGTMKERLGDTEKGRRIAEILIPDFPIGCRRQTPGIGFLESLVRPNVEVIQDGIVRVTKEGIVCKDGEKRSLDVIICATGFDTTFKPRIPIVGQNGLDLRRKWDQEDPEAYFGIAVPGFPNYFSFLGPNSPISNGTLVGGLQMTAVYIYKAISKLQTQSIKSLAIKPEVVRDYNIHCHKWLERSVWTAPCASWYKRGTKDGKVVAIYAGTSYHFMEALREPRWEDYEYEYEVDAGGVGRNRFAYLGNGHTVDEEHGENMAKIQTLDFDEYWDIVA